ncbi:MAG: hypothetical protein LBF37_03770 [Rickettsiales bacterium]|jgi:myo-inositol-1(or 4)-monophosphatase|nr:hypothetical protein [Rickettsiales bacterium]
MINKIISFIEQVGVYALKQQRGIDFNKSKFKTEGIGDPVTETDTTVSKRFYEFVSENFSELDYVIVDEESVSDLGDNPIAKLKNAEYVFVIDPIDGTLTYANKYPLWAISVGVFKNGQPFVGAVYAPALDILVWSDETKAYVRENGKITELAEQSDVAPIMLHYHDSKKIHVNDKDNNKTVQGLGVYSQVLSAIYVATGRARGYYYQAFIWDIAGILPILNKVGVKVLGYDDGTEFDWRKNLGQNLRAEKVYIVCQPKYFDYLKSVVDVR